MYNSNSEIIEINQYLLDNKDKLQEDIGEKIRLKREEKNLSVEEISFRSLMSNNYITQIERGKYGVSLSKFLLICNALEVTPDEILEEFISGGRTNDDILYNKLQEGKNISKNILEYMKEKKQEL